MSSVSLPLRDLSRGRHPKFLLFRTLSRTGDPARFALSNLSGFFFLLPLIYALCCPTLSHPTFLRVSRDPLVSPFCCRTYPSAILVFIVRRFFIFSRGTRFFPSFSFSPAGLRVLVLYFLLPLPLTLSPAPVSPSISFPLSISVFFLSSPDILSRIFHDYPFLDPFFLFYLSFASFRILRIRFSAHTLYVSLLFTHRSRPPLGLTLRFVLSPVSPSLSPPLPRLPPSLIPLSLSASPSSIYFDRS